MHLFVADGAAPSLGRIRCDRNAVYLIAFSLAKPVMNCCNGLLALIEQTIFGASGRFRTCAYSELHI